FFLLRKQHTKTTCSNWSIPPYSCFAFHLSSFSSPVAHLSHINEHSLNLLVQHRQPFDTQSHTSDEFTFDNFRAGLAFSRILRDRAEQPRLYKSHIDIG